MMRSTVDAFTFIGQSLFGSSQTSAELLSKMDAAQIERAIVCPLKPPGYLLGPANDMVADAVAREPRLVGLARVDPNQEQDALPELDRATRLLGLKGLFLHPWEETFRINGPRVDPILARCAELQIPVVIASGYPWVSEAAQVGDLARRFPAVTLVMTHGGQINISGLGQADALGTLQRHANVCMETSASIDRIFWRMSPPRSAPSGYSSAATARSWTCVWRWSGRAGRTWRRTRKR